MTDPPSGLDAPRASEALAALGDEIRLSILEALFAADDPLSFSALRDEVGVADSGQFNYHLKKLLGTFVRKTDEGYELRYAGSQIVGAVLSGVFTRDERVDPIAISVACPLCDGQLVAAYEDERASVRCAACEATITRFGVAPGIVDGFEREELPLAFSRWIATTIARVRAGFCNSCTGRMRGSIGFSDAVVEEEGDDDLADLPLGATYTCERCGERLSSTIGGMFLTDPPVVAFLHDHDVDLFETAFWELPWLFEDHAEVVSEDPKRAEVRITTDDEALVMLVDDDLEVLSWSREPRS